MSTAASKRLSREFKTLQDENLPFIYARPDESNILEWHFIISGPPQTPYENGQYHGILKFPPQYPFKPPAIKVVTPSGRFVPNVRLCLSMSDYHPELWNPSWTVGTILTGLLSFMTGNENTSGSMITTDATKRQYAKQSWRYNATTSPVFMKHLSDFADASGFENKSTLNTVTLPKPEAPMITQQKETKSIAKPVSESKVTHEKESAQRLTESKRKKSTEELKQDKKTKNGDIVEVLDSSDIEEVEEVKDTKSNKSKKRFSFLRGKKDKDKKPNPSDADADVIVLD